MLVVVPRFGCPAFFVAFGVGAGPVGGGTVVGGCRGPACIHPAHHGYVAFHDERRDLHPKSMYDRAHTTDFLVHAEAFGRDNHFLTAFSHIKRRSKRDERIAQRRQGMLQRRIRAQRGDIRNRLALLLRLGRGRRGRQDMRKRVQREFSRDTIPLYRARYAQPARSAASPAPSPTRLCFGVVEMEHGCVEWAGYASTADEGSEFEPGWFGVCGCLGPGGFVPWAERLFGCVEFSFEV